MNIQLLFLPFFMGLTLMSLSILGRWRDRLSVVFSFAPLLILLSLSHEGSEYIYHYELSKLTTLSFGFRLNDIALFFGILITLTAPLVTTFLYYQAPSERFLVRFHPLFHILLSGILIALLAADFISFLAGWEITSWSAYFLLMLNKSDNRRNRLFFLITTQLSTYLLVLGGLILYAHSGSFLFTQQESTLITLNANLQMLILGLFLSAFLFRMGSFPLIISSLRVLQNAPKILSFLFVASLFKIPLYGLFAFSLYFVFDYFEATHQVRVLYEYCLIFMGGGTIWLGYYLALKGRYTRAFLPALAIAESGYLILWLASLSYYSFGGFFLLALNHTLALTLLYFAWLHPRYSSPSHAPSPYHLSIASMVGALGLLGIPPFFGFGLKVMLMESFMDKGYGEAVVFMLAMHALAWGFVALEARTIYGYFKRQEVKLVKPQSLIALLVTAAILALGILPWLQRQIIELAFMHLDWIDVSWGFFPLSSALNSFTLPYLGIILAALALAWAGVRRYREP